MHAFRPLITYGVVSAGFLALTGTAAAQGEATPPGPSPEQGQNGQSSQSGDTAGPIVVDPIDVRGRAPAGGVSDLVSDRESSADADRALDDPAFVTVVRIDDRAGETVSVAEVLAKSMAVHIRSLGGLGGFSSVSVRGASSGHTTVLIDGVPLSRIASASVDLGRLSLTSFSRLELYRGNVPVEYGGGALGGALDLVTGVGRPPSGRPLHMAAGFGSFGARHLQARWRDGRDDDSLGYHLALGYAGARGDFDYFNDNGTNLDPDDDRFERRANNGYHQIDAVARHRAQLGDWEVTAGSRTLFKTQGIPGTASVQSRDSHLTTLAEILDLGLDKQRLLGSPRLSGRATAFAALEQQSYRDLTGEIGVGEQHRRYRSLGLGSTARVTVDAGPTHNLTVGAEARFDRFTETDALPAARDSLRSHGWRSGLGLTAVDDIRIGAAEPWVLAPAVRLDWLRTVPTADPDQPVMTDDALSPRTEVFLSPRLAYRARPVDGLVIKGSAGRYFRAPTIVELFGDRGFIRGNPQLDAETGLSGDLGLIWSPPSSLGPLDRIYLEAAFFGRRVRDTIAFVTTSGLVARAFNVADSLAYGLEAGASVRIARSASVSGNYTLLATRQDSPTVSYDGKPLPHRPRHELYGRIDVARRLLDRVFVAWSDASFTAGNTLDRAGLFVVPSRLLFGAGLKAEMDDGLIVAAEIKNLTNARLGHRALDPPPRPDLTHSPYALADFFGYPLPGRAFYLSVEWNR